jgi:hypothetical protein
MDLLNTLESLSFTSAAVLVAISSALGAACALLCRRRAMRVGIALGLPVALSYSLYWLPVWRGAGSAEYSAWEAIILVWVAVGWGVALTVLGTAWLVRYARNPPPN